MNNQLSCAYLLVVAYNDIVGESLLQAPSFGDVSSLGPVSFCPSVTPKGVLPPTLCHASATLESA